MFFTCEANELLADFIRDVYWDRYSGGRNFLLSNDAADFVTNAVREGKRGMFGQIRQLNVFPRTY